jgi:hypothetical protein
VPRTRADARGRLPVILALALALLPGGRALAAAGADPDWPCVQRLVPELAAGQVWAGEPPLDALPADAALAPPVADMPGRIAGRRLPPEEAARLAADALAKVPEPERAAQRALVFREALRLINRERGELVAGIKRYAKRQRALADKITGDGRRLVELRRDPAQATTVAELDNARAWDMRVFDERQRALDTLCDQPVRLEQRAFALGRLLAAQGQTAQ